MKKTLIMDLDGTLLRDNGTVSEYTKRVIRKASEEYTLIAASGRAISGIRKALDDLFPLFTFFICYNGAVVYHKDELIKENILSPQQVNWLYQIAKRHNADFRAFRDNCETVLETEEALVEAEKNNMEIILTDTFSPAYKATMTSEFDINGLFNSLEKLHLPNVSIVKSDNRNIDIGNGKVSKGVALAYICEKFNIDYKDTIAFGDAGNDIDMICFSEIGVAMNNAMNETKEYATYITEYDNDHDGVAEFIDNHFLTRKVPKVIEDIRNLNLRVDENTESITINVQYEFAERKFNAECKTNRKFEVIDDFRLRISNFVKPKKTVNIDNVEIEEITITQFNAEELKLNAVQFRKDFSIKMFIRYISDGKQLLAEDVWEENDNGFVSYHSVDVYDPNNPVSSVENEWKKIKENCYS